MIAARLSLNAFRWIFVATILASSAITLIQSIGDSLAVASLATVEIMAACAFATDQWRRVGALILVLVFAVALALSAVIGEFAVRFFYFAASAIYLQGLDGPSDAALIAPAKE
jgi:hypothetical protein